MDIFDPKLWRDTASLVWAMPQLIIPAFILVVLLAYLLGKKSTSEGLSEMNKRTDAVKRQSDIVNQRLGFASDKGQKVAEKLQEAEIELANLRFRISELANSLPDGAVEMLVASGDQVAENIRDVASANNELRHALSDDPNADASK